jgi:hypothetical protein
MSLISHHNSPRQFWLVLLGNLFLSVRQMLFQKQFEIGEWWWVWRQEYLRRFEIQFRTTAWCGWTSREAFDCVAIGIDQEDICLAEVFKMNIIDRHSTISSIRGSGSPIVNVGILTPIEFLFQKPLSFSYIFSKFKSNRQSSFHATFQSRCFMTMIRVIDHPIIVG